MQSAPGPAAPTPAASIVPVRDITVYCRHEFEDATLLLLDGERIIYKARLVGKKRRGFIGIGGKGFGGVLTETVTIPGDAQELTARVYSSDGALNVLQKISAHPPSEYARTLRITPTKDQLKLEWQNPKAAAK